jgi:hypothetical protein
MSENGGMGSRLYDFLSDSFLFRNDFLEDTNTSSLNEIQKELERYREFCLQNERAFYTDAAGEDSSLTLYSAEEINVPDLLQAALYVKKYILQDPLFELTAKRSEAGKTLTKAGFVEPPSTDGELNVQRVRRVLKFMKALTPMIAGNFVKFVPSSKTMEDTEEIPLYASDNYFEDALPAEVLRKYKGAAAVSAVVSLGEGRIRFEPLKPTRGISIRFRGDEGETRSMYSLHQIEKMELKDGTENEFTFRATIPNTPPDRDYFRAWVQQSVNLAARNRFRETYEHAEMAARLNAALSTRSQLRFDVLRTVVEPSTSEALHTANTFLNMDLPLLVDLDVENLMKVREEDGEAFANFRFALDHKLSSLREVSDMPTAKRMAKEAIQDLTEVQLHDVRLKVGSLREKMGLSAIGGGIGLAAAVQNQGWGLLSAAAAAVPIASAYLDYRKDVKRHPAFFLWKALGKAARKRH